MPSTWDFGPEQWRRLFTPAGAGWILCAVTGFGYALRLEPVTVLSAFAGWGAVGAAALAGAAVVERGWLAAWPRAGGALVRARQRRWENWRSRAAQIAPQDRAAAAVFLRRSSAICPVRPIAATWTADRWAALDSRVFGAYGLDLASSWPRLWPLLPPPSRADLEKACAAWHRSCRWMSWAALYAVLAVAWPPAAAIAAPLALVAWAGGRAAIARQADLIESAYDLYAPRLARLLFVPLPPPGRLDVTRGLEITARLRKGS